MRSLISELDHFEIARRLHELNVEQKVRVFHLLENDEVRQELLYETDMDSRLEIQENLDRDYLAALLDGMPEDEATDIIQELPDEAQEELLSKMESQDAEIIKDLIRYEEETAGGLMTPHFNKILHDNKAGDIFTKVRRDTNKETTPYFYVVDDKDKLIGYFKLRDLMNIQTSALATEFVRPTTPKVKLNDPCEKVAHIMGQEHLSSLPVVDENNVIQGVITFDDVLRTMQDSASEDIYTMVGTATVDPFAKKISNKILARAPWLFTTGDIQQDNLAKVVKSEISVGILNGVIFGLMCGGLVHLISESILHTNPVLGWAVGTGIFLAVSIASLMGSLTPILFINMDIDPAISAGPIITVINDILGLAIYLATAAYYFSSLQ